jgi:DNA-binding CsgD family transcriptional regulator
MAVEITRCKERQLLALVNSITEAGCGIDRVERAIDGVTDLLGGEVGGFNDVDFVERTLTGLMRPAVSPEVLGAVRRTLDKHPIVRHFVAHPQDRHPQRMSDRVTGRWEDHEVYSEVFRPMGTPHVVIIPLPWKLPLQTGSAYVVMRSGLDFTEKEMQLSCAIRAALQLLHQVDGTVAAAGRLEMLSNAERELVELIGRVLTTTEIAKHRNRSVATVRTQRANIYAKLGVHDRASIIRLMDCRPAMPRPVDRLREILGG